VAGIAVLRGALALILAAACLTGCNQRPGADTPIVLKEPLGTAPEAILAPSADYHLVTVRPRVGTGEQILCAEPSPDWAVAFGTALSASANASVTGQGSGALSSSYNTTEAITQMAGRSAGVVALRDGLYSACQAYANGIIGKDAYALILSQYGNLLVALASGGGGGGGSGSSTSSGTSSGSTTGAPVAVSVSTGGTSAPAASSGQKQSGPAGGGSQTDTTQLQQMQTQMLQALMVACISNADTSIPGNNGNANTLLSVNCGKLLTEMATKFIAQSGGAAPAATKPKPAPEKSP